MPEVGKYYWVRFKDGIRNQWEPGRIFKTNGLLWVALVYSTAHYGLAHFEVGEELVHQ